MTQIPSYWDGLAKSSVYYELLDEDTGKLEPIYEKAEFELDNNGKIVYYGASYDGGYSRDIAGGEFLRARHIDESGKVVDVFLHYTQVFQPTSAARKTMDYATTILGVIYQNTNRQLAYMEDYLTQAKRANEVLEKLTELYNRFTVNATNMDVATELPSTYITADQIRAYLDAGMTLPQTEFISGVAPIPYARDYSWWVGEASNSDYIFYLFRTGDDGNIMMEQVASYSGGDGWENFNEPGKVKEGCLLDSYWKDWQNTYFSKPDDILKFLSADGEINVTSKEASGFDPENDFYYPCIRDSNNNWARDKGHRTPTDEKTLLRASDFKKLASLDEVLENDYNVYLNYREMASIQDQVRAQIDVANNILDTITTMVGVANNDMNQNFTIGTSTLATVENGLKNITINTH